MLGMELRLKTFYPSSSGLQLVDIFGYTTRGMPSLELHGSWQMAKLFKEKILFLTKSRKMLLPPRRYILCMDMDQGRCDTESMRDFELPFLILFWSLGEILPIRRLEDCVCAGRIYINGLIQPKKLNQEYIQFLINCKEKFKFIGEAENISPSIPLISLNSLMKEVSNIKIKI